MRKMFLGGNTAQGFYSFYDQIIGEDARRVFILKGGAGTGKSTFMRKIGLEMQEKGFEVDFYYCSSDNDSLDGVAFPKLKVALLDGTAPHIVDPVNPGVIEEIINLGEYWDRDALRPFKTEILNINQEIKRLFGRAYDYLKIANDFLEKQSLYLNINHRALDNFSFSLIKEIFKFKPSQNKSFNRHLFAGAITPKGCVNYLDNLMDSLGKRYIIIGESRKKKNLLLSRFLEAFNYLGFSTEVFHCALNPNNIEHLIIHDIDTAIISSSQAHFYQPKFNDTIIDISDFIEPPNNTQCLSEINTVKNFYRETLALGIDFIARAKKEHDSLEEYYIPYMDFDRIEEKRKEVLSQILVYSS